MHKHIHLKLVKLKAIIIFFISNKLFRMKNMTNILSYYLTIHYFVLVDSVLKLLCLTLKYALRMKKTTFFISYA